MLLELSVMEQRYQAVLAVLQDGREVTVGLERAGWSVCTVVKRARRHFWRRRFHRGS